jgi:hypothetical protein
MRCPFSLCESLDHFTYQCPMIIEYRHRQMALIQNPTPPPPAEPVITPTPSLDMLFISSHLNLRHSLLPHGSWMIYMRIYPQIPPILQFISPRKFYPTTIFNPQYLDIWFMSSEPSQPPCITPLHLHHQKTTTR